MNKKRQILLFKALKNGRIDINQANRLYSGNSGKDALLSLEYLGYLKHTGFGNFVPDLSANFPEEVVEKYKDWAGAKSEDEKSDRVDDTESKIDDSDHSSDYSIVKQ